MPYTVARNDAGEYCVYKQDENGDPIGETLGCHETQEEAGAQIGAITNAEAQAAKQVMFRQSEVNYSTASPNTPNELCANCRWFVSNELDDEWEPKPAYCHLVEPWPLTILPTGYCDRWEEMPDPNTAGEAPPIPVIIVEEQYRTPEQQGWASKLLARLTGQPQEGNLITRDGDGKRLALIFTSNGYKDRQDEFVSAGALKEYVESCYQDGEWVGDNKLLFWHWPKVDIGDIVYADMVADTFLLEVAKERDTPLAKTFWDYWEGHPQELNGASHAFHPLEKPENGTVYRHIRKVETSILPRDAAANLLTYGGIVKMKDRKEQFDKMFFDGAAALLEQKGPLAVIQHMQAHGLETRALEAHTGDEVTKEQPSEMVDTLIKAVTGMIEGQSDLLETVGEQQTAIEGMLEAQTTRQKAADETMTALQALSEQVKALEKKLGAAPKRASQNPETVVSKDDDLEVVETHEPEVDPLIAQAFGKRVFEREE